MRCVVCEDDGIIDIPVITRTISLCKRCLIGCPSHIKIEILREADTKMLDVFFMKIIDMDNTNLLVMQLQDEVKKIKDATKYGLLESLQRNRDLLVQENEKLTSELQHNQDQITSMKYEIDKLQNSLNEDQSVYGCVEENSDKICALIKKQNSRFDTISEQIGIVEQMLSEKLEKEKPVIVDAIKSLLPTKTDIVEESDEG